MPSLARTSVLSFPGMQVSWYPLETYSSGLANVSNALVMSGSFELEPGVPREYPLGSQLWSNLLVHL